ncbi:MAG: hypothetical protein JSV33_04020 [bacterium]|nr:MAG: hypothetical protein JSV33_04020 [bacterium]
MRCKKAQDCYFKNRDGLLNEAEKMKLQEHLSDCKTCADFSIEMDRCLGLLKDLPDVSPSENFEWNIKRRILEEKSRMIRSREGSPFGQWRWGVKFAASAAAAAVLVFTGVWFLLGHGEDPALRSTVTAVHTPSRQSRVPSMPRNYEILDMTGMNYPQNMRMVSGNLGLTRRGSSSEIYMPFEDAAISRSDSLAKINLLLKRHIQGLEAENRALRQYLSQVRSRR